MDKLLLLCMLFFMSCHCEEPYDPDQFISSELIPVARSQKRWTGVAVEKSGRLFANFPNSSADHSISVAELKDSIQQFPYPDLSWNTWSAGMDPEEHFIAVQSVYVDNNNYLWVLDAANPQRQGEFQGIVAGGAKLIKIDLATNEVIETVVFDLPVIKNTSYLNDIRIDEQRNVAYITDSNEGALIITDLTTGNSKRIFDTHPAVKSENTILYIDGTPYRTAKGEYPVIHADGIALSPDRSALYWRALTSRSLYWILCEDLLNPGLSAAQLMDRIHRAELELLPADGMISDNTGVLYMASVTDHAIHAYRKNTFWRVRKSPLLKWPDSFSISSDNYLFVTTSQVNVANPHDPYRIYKFKLP